MTLSQIEHQIFQNYRILTERISDFFPVLFASFLLICAGLLCGFLSKKALNSLATHTWIKKTVQKSKLQQSIDELGLQGYVGHLGGSLAFWIIFLFFFINAVELLQAGLFHSLIESFSVYVPQIMTSFLVFFAGLFFSQFLKRIILNAGTRANIEYAPAIAHLAHALILILVVIIALSQFEIKLDLVVHIIEICVFLIGATLVLALGLGSKDVAKNIISGVYAREKFIIGSRISVHLYDGILRDIGPVNFTLEVNEGSRIYLPNEYLIKNHVTETAG